MGGEEGKEKNIERNRSRLFAAPHPKKTATSEHPTVFPASRVASLHFKNAKETARFHDIKFLLDFFLQRDKRFTDVVP